MVIIKFCKNQSSQKSKYSSPLTGYISIADNTESHGPGSQQSHNPYEADANFGSVVEGMDDVVRRIHSVAQEGWLDRTNQVKIVKMTVMIPDKYSGFKDWLDWTKM